MTISLADNQNGTVGMVGYMVGNTAQQNRLKSVQPPASEDNQITGFCLGSPNDLLCGVPNLFAALVRYVQSIHHPSRAAKNIFGKSVLMKILPIMLVQTDSRHFSKRRHIGHRQKDVNDYEA